ncbi:unnamed protein product [Auanema sp. JU1783]|nr:unnamed protein product [Auanema sp. JU1783]
MFYIPFDFYQISYGVTTCVLVVLVMGIFARRQIVRLRVNSARNKPNVNLPFSKKARNGIDLQLERVENLRLSYQPRFTECTTICQHNNTPYVNRMIAIDEVALEIDGLMAKLGNERQPAEKTVDYLTRLRVKFPALPASLCYRIAYLHEAARLGPQKFDVEQRMELRSLINQFVKLVGKGDFNIEQPPPSKNIVSSLYHKLNPSSSQRRNRHKFGGSDGGRLLAGTVAEEQVALLPMDIETPSRLRRQSESHRSFL